MGSLPHPQHYFAAKSIFSTFDKLLIWSLSPPDFKNKDERTFWKMFEKNLEISHSYPKTWDFKNIFQNFCLALYSKSGGLNFSNILFCQNCLLVIYFFDTLHSILFFLEILHLIIFFEAPCIWFVFFVIPFILICLLWHPVYDLISWDTPYLILVILGHPVMYGSNIGPNFEMVSNTMIFNVGSMRGTPFPKKIILYKKKNV